MTLGAAVGEAVLGRKAGNKAILWGAVAGTVPDLDVLILPFVSEMQGLAIHRGFSHSLVFAILFAPFLGWFIRRMHGENSGASRRDWSWMVFWATVTHPILDIFTVYGTQFFQPFSNYPAAVSSIFIIDPLYTIPLILGVLLALFLRRSSPKRRLVNYLTLGFSTAYLLAGLAVKFHVETIFTAALERQGIPHDRLLTTPSPFNIILWSGMAEDDQGQWVGLYSLLDDDERISFRRVDKNRDLIADYLHQPPLQRLLWFSRGYYTVAQSDSGLYFIDLRFGRTDNWLSEEGDYIFRFRLHFDPQNPQRVVGFHQERPDFATRGKLFTRLIHRVRGERILSQAFP